jgi:uncharacterized RDD family membrane protein YckC
MLPENLTYFVRGEDGSEYGPVDLAELREWVAENRAGLGTEVRRDEPDVAWQEWQDFPELVALLAEVHATSRLDVAPLWRRAAAFALDLFLASLLSLPALYVIQAYSGIPDLEMRFAMALIGPDSQASPDVLFYGNIANIVNQTLLVMYFTCFLAAHGQTPAKQLLRLRVVTADGQKPYLAKSLLRALALVFSTNLLFLPLLWVFFNSERRAPHDLIAGTYVVEA